MAALACYKAAFTPSAYKPKIISVADEPLVLKRKNHSWRPVKNNAPLEKFGYILGDKIGEGPYSRIHLGYNPKEKSHAAVKVIKKDKIPRKIFERFIKREIYIMQQFQHPHIIGVNEVVESKNHIYIVMEYAENGDLLQYVNEAGVLPEVEARRLFRQIIAAVKVLHEAKVVHRDIKLDNILLDRDNNVKLADFGFARLQYSYELCKTFCGSYSYAAPEVIDGDDYDGKLADVWSLGICLYGMLHGKLPFHEEDIDILRQSMDEEIHFNAIVTKECSHLIRSMLRVDRSQRVTLADVVASPWMTLPLVAIPEEDDDDLDSTWSIISRREPSDAGGSVSNSTLSSQGACRNVEDPHVPAEHGYNSDQKHVRDVATTIVTDVLTAVAINSCRGVKKSVSSAGSSGTDIGVTGAVGRKISSELQSISQCGEIGLVPAPKTGRRSSAGFRRRSLLSDTPRRTSTSGGRVHQLIEQGSSRKSLVSELNGLAYTASGRVAKYLGEEQRNSSAVLRKKSLQRMSSTESIKRSPEDGLFRESSSVANFLTKCMVANSHSDGEN